MTSRFLYTAQLAPINRTVTTRFPGEGLKNIRIDEYALALEQKHPERVKLHIGHDVSESIGHLHALVQHQGWYLATFGINPDVISAETEERIRPGMPVSVGLSIVRSEKHDLSGIETIRQATLDELSLTRAGMIEGAKILSKDDLRPYLRSTRSSPARALPSDRPAAGEAFFPAPGTIIRRPNSGTIIGVR